MCLTQTPNRKAREQLHLWDLWVSAGLSALNRSRQKECRSNCLSSSKCGLHKGCRPRKKNRSKNFLLNVGAVSRHSGNPQSRRDWLNPLRNRQGPKARPPPTRSLKWRPGIYIGWSAIWSRPNCYRFFFRKSPQKVWLRSWIVSTYKFVEHEGGPYNAKKKRKKKGKKKKKGKRGERRGEGKKEREERKKKNPRYTNPS